MVQTQQLPKHPLLFTIPPLENGDRLSRMAFERRYAAMPEDCKAELIQGIVYTSAALRYRSHGLPHSQINAWFATDQIFTPGIGIASADHSTFCQPLSH